MLASVEITEALKLNTNPKMPPPASTAGGIPETTRSIANRAPPGPTAAHFSTVPKEVAVLAGTESGCMSSDTLIGGSGIQYGVGSGTGHQYRRFGLVHSQAGQSGDAG